MKEINLVFDPAQVKWPSLELKAKEAYRLTILGSKTKPLRILEFYDGLFRLESAVVVPEREIPSEGTQLARTVSPIGMVAAVLRYAQEHRDHTILVAGHTDTSGGLDYNRELSQNRARTLLSLLTDDASTFADICHQINKWMKVSDYKQILTWLAETRGWACNPGTIDDSHDNQTQEAVHQFKIAYNASGPGAQWAPKLSTVWGDPNTKETWEAYFHCYEEYIAEELGTDVQGLASYRGCLKFASPNQWVGCNEHHPRTLPGVDDLREQSNRRVEVLAFLPGDEPATLDCCPDRNGCSKERCILYDDSQYTPSPWVIGLDMRLRLLDLDYQPVANGKCQLVDGLGTRQYDADAEGWVTIRAPLGAFLVRWELAGTAPDAIRFYWKSFVFPVRSSSSPRSTNYRLANLHFEGDTGSAKLADFAAYFDGLAAASEGARDDEAPPDHEDLLRGWHDEGEALV